MLLHKLNNSAYHGYQVGYPHPGYSYSRGNLQGATRLASYAAPPEGRMLYDGLGNPVGILPFIAALAPLAMKALTALPAIAGKAATLLPQITSAASALMPPPSAPAALAPAAAMPVMSPQPMPPVPMPIQLPSIETVNVPMRENDGRLVIVRRRLVRRGRRRRPPVSPTTMVERLPTQQQPRSLQGWIGWPPTWN